MKPVSVPVAIALIWLGSCSKSTNIRVDAGLYTGVCVLRMPLAPPNDSLGTTVTLTIAGKHFSGSADTSTWKTPPAIGGGTYSSSYGHITFNQDSALYQLESDAPVLSGQYNLLKTGDSLVFVRVPPPGVRGAGSIYYRLRRN